jgi:hypothetical protein
VLLLRGIGLRVRVRPQPFAKIVGGAHCGALTVGWAEAGKGKPRFVPKEYKVPLDGETFLHHAFDVVHQTVKGAVGQKQHTHPIQLARRLKFQKLMLDLFQGHSAIHRIFVQRIAIEIDHFSPGQNHSVMV